MSIIYHESTRTFHLTNGKISYLMKVFPDGTLGQLYFGKAVRDREGFDHLLEMKSRPMSAIAGAARNYSLEHCKQEYPAYGSTDFRHPAVELRQPNGSRHPFDQFIVSKTPAGRWGDPEDLAGPAVFLASDASNFVNGHVLYVDGGILAYIGKQP